ncbi:unnamed protein product [Rotaria sordida]|nr:unnamed protein product [Rotaria sordida]
MIKLGIRNNDFGILWRNNHYTIDPEEDEKQKLYGKYWFAACLLLGFPLYILWDMMVMHKSNKNIFKLIRKKLFKKNIKKLDNNINNELTTNKKIIDINGTVIDSDVEQFNTLVNRMALFDVSADQVEEVSAAVVEAQ